MFEDKEIKELLLVHVEIQDKLNEYLVSKDWHKEINTFQIKMAIISECGELVDSTDYKWWTKSEIDYENMKIEVVDIWHFLLTFYLYYVRYDFINRNDETVVMNLISGYEDVKRWLIKPNIQFIGSDIIRMLKSLDMMITREPNLITFYYMGYLIFDVNMTLEEFDKLYRAKVKLNMERKIKGYDKNPNVKYIDGKEDNKLLTGGVNNE